MSIDSAERQLIKYVAAVANLVISLERDIKAGNKISPDTVAKLSKLVAEEASMSKLVDQIEAASVKLQ